MSKLDFWRSREFLGLSVGVMPPGGPRDELTTGLTHSALNDHVSSRCMRQTDVMPAGSSGLWVTQATIPFPPLARIARHAGISQRLELPRTRVRAAFARPATVQAGLLF